MARTLRSTVTGATLALAMVLPRGVRADPAPDPRPSDPTPSNLGVAPAIFYKVALGSRTVAEARGTMSLLVERLDDGAKGRIDARDADVEAKVRLAAIRASKVAGLLAYDIHDKGRVTAHDVEERVMLDGSALTPARVADRVKAVMNLDLDHDGAVDFAEMRTLTPFEVRPAGIDAADQILAAYGEPVDDAEVMRRFDAFVAAVNTEAKGFLSPADRDRVRDLAATARKRATAPEDAIADGTQPRRGVNLPDREGATAPPQATPAR